MEQETRFVLGMDPHNSDIAPSSRVDNYTETILSKMSFMVDFTIDKKAILLLAGDIFHRKKPKLNSHYLVNRLMSLFERLGKDRVYAVRGNHDLLSVDDELEKAPLGVLINAGVLTLLGGCPTLVGNTSLNGMPWSEDMEIVPHLFELPHLKAKWQLSMFHQYVIPEDVVFPGPHLKFSEVYPFLPEISFFGHFHDGFSGGAVKFGDKILINPGAIAREKATKSNLSRELRFGYLVLPDEGRPKYSNIAIPHKKSSIVFDLTKKAAAEAQLEKLEELVRHFAAGIKEVENVDLSCLEDLLGLVKSLKLPPDIEETVNRLLQEADEETQ